MTVSAGGFAGPASEAVSDFDDVGPWFAGRAGAAGTTPFWASENVYGLWPYHLHRAMREDTHSEDRWTDTDWYQAATRALGALGEQWTAAATLGPSRLLLVACLHQGLRLARDHRLADLGWLTAAAYTYTDDSVWKPLPLPADTTGAPDTPADTLAELLTAITRRQHEQWNHTCAFYFGGHTIGTDYPIYLRVHASPEGRDYDQQIKTLRQVGTPEDWMARAFPQEAVQHHDQHHQAGRLR
ncbi:hypothetical protein ACIOHO_40825 [Streptomyces sp. NPDC087849]|uniref:hypothetical protein n=1 Tax=Streptomyces sp. NPDC087849 TaxID=3365808 RepID=UPI00382C6B04